ncbi:MAG: hypothetical protein Q8P67_27755, partial [archaeon]|nr:hypothetical protein [archaeon]
MTVQPRTVLWPSHLVDIPGAMTAAAEGGDGEPLRKTVQLILDQWVRLHSADPARFSGDMQTFVRIWYRHRFRGLEPSAERQRAEPRGALEEELVRLPASLLTPLDLALAQALVLFPPLVTPVIDTLVVSLVAGSLTYSADFQPFLSLLQLLSSPRPQHAATAFAVLRRLLQTVHKPPRHRSSHQTSPPSSPHSSSSSSSTSSAILQIRSWFFDTLCLADYAVGVLELCAAARNPALHQLLIDIVLTRSLSTGRYQVMSRLVSASLRGCQALAKLPTSVNALLLAFFRIDAQHTKLVQSVFAALLSELSSHLLQELLLALLQSSSSSSSTTTTPTPSSSSSSSSISSITSPSFDSDSFNSRWLLQHFLPVMLDHLEQGSLRGRQSALELFRVVFRHQNGFFQLSPYTAQRHSTSSSSSVQEFLRQVSFRDPRTCQLLFGAWRSEIDPDMAAPQLLEQRWPLVRDSLACGSPAALLASSLFPLLSHLVACVDGSGGAMFEVVDFFFFGDGEAALLPRLLLEEPAL